MFLNVRDEEGDECAVQAQTKQTELQNNLTTNPFLDVPNSASAIEYKKGYVMRKCCYEANAKKSEYFKVLIIYLCFFYYAHIFKI